MKSQLIVNLFCAHTDEFIELSEGQKWKPDDHISVVPIIKIDMDGKTIYATWTQGELEGEKPAFNALGMIKLKSMNAIEGIKMCAMQQVEKGATPTIEKMRETLARVPDNGSVVFFGTDRDHLEENFYSLIEIDPRKKIDDDRVIIATEETVPLRGDFLEYGPLMAE